MSDSRPPDRRPVILLVDDEPALLDVMRERLIDSYDIETAISAAEADVLLGLQRFDLVMCDHLMPGENGLEFLMRVRQHFPATRRILVTGYVNPDLLSRAQMLAELSSCLLKPVGQEQLFVAVREALAS